MLEVVIEFEAVNQDVLKVEGTVKLTPTISIPYDLFRMDCSGVAKMILLITFMDVPVVRGVMIVFAVTASADVARSTVTRPTKSAAVLMLAVEATI
jgi:hypothetical protein